MKAETKIMCIESKLNRWQKMIDNTMNPRNPVIQQARDEVRQECIDAIRSIIQTGEPK